MEAMRSSTKSLALLVLCSLLSLVSAQRNIARSCLGGCATSQFPTGAGDSAEAVDGNSSNLAALASASTCSDTGPSNFSWWSVDFGVERKIEYVTIYDRSDLGTFEAGQLSVSIGNTSDYSQGISCYSTSAYVVSDPFETNISCSGIGKYVFITLNNSLILCEVQVFGGCLYSGEYLSWTGGNSIDASGECQSCPGNTFNPTSYGESINDCICESGYEAISDGIACSACEDAYKNTTGSGLCTLCPANSSAAQASTELTDCVCNVGFEGSDGGPCSACSAGTFKATLGSGLCEDCPADTFAEDIASSACVDCPFGRVSSEASTNSSACVCERGFSGPDGENCTACGAGSFKGVRGSGACYNCSEGFFSLAGSSSCSHCLDGEYSGATASACIACTPSDVLQRPQCLGTGSYGIREPHCCWEPELGCGAASAVLDTERNCSRAVKNVDAWVSGSHEITISWSLRPPNSEGLQITGYNLVVYDASLGYDAVPPYSTLAKRRPGGQFNADLNHYVAPCRIWYTYIDGVDGTGLWEESTVSGLEVIDSGLGAGPGNLSIAGGGGEGFRARYSVCPLPWNELDVAGELTGRSARVCDLSIEDPGRYYFREGTVDVTLTTVSDSSGANGTNQTNQTVATTPTPVETPELVLAPRIAYTLSRGVSAAACVSSRCRPAFRLDNASASLFNNSLGVPFLGPVAGRQYAFAVIPQDARGFGKFPPFEADVLGTFTPGGWTTQVALRAASAPTALSLSSCSPGAVAVTWGLPTDLGALSEGARRAASTPLGQLFPFSALEAIGGIEGILGWHVQLSSTAGFDPSASVNSSYTVAQAAAKEDNSSYSIQLEATAGARVYLRVRVQTAAGMGAWALASIDVEAAFLPTAPPVTALAWHQREAKVEVYWWAPFDTGRSNGTAMDHEEPILSYTVRLQGTVLYQGVPADSTACGLSNEGGGLVCCVQRRRVETVCGPHSVCERMRLSLTGAPLGVSVEAGGVYNVTVAAANEVGEGPASFVRVEFGTARDMWARPAARCSSNRLPECAAGLAGAQCAYSNMSRAWCNGAPGLVSAFGAVAPADTNECETGVHNCGEKARCVDAAGSFECPCKEGFHGVGDYVCEDDDECAAGTHTCAEGAVCVNAEGNYSCVCGANFFGDGASNCTACPFDLVSAPNSSAPEACACAAGFNQSSAGWCDQDLDECAAGLDSCDPSIAFCYNTEGSFQCLCSSGSYGDGANCTACPAQSNSSLGSSSIADCICLEGYLRIDTPCFGMLCVEEDECATRSHDCGWGVPCENTAGGFECLS